MRKDSTEFIKGEYPSTVRSQFVPMVSRAYSVVEQLMTDNEILNWSIGNNMRGYLINTAVEYEFKRMIESGRLPLSYRIGSNLRKNHQHIEVCSNHSILTISQMKNSNKPPRKAYFRANLGYSNQLMMQFLEDDIKVIDSPLYIVLTHGSKHGNLEFVNLGMPQPHLNTWISCIELMQEPQLIENTELSRIDTEELLVELKEYIRKEKEVK